MSAAVAAPAPSEPDEQFDAEVYGKLLDFAVRSYVGVDNGPFAIELGSFLSAHLGNEALEALIEQEVQRTT